MAEPWALLLAVLFVTFPALAETPPFGSAQLTVQGSRLTLFGDSQTVDWDQTVNVGEPIRIRTCYGSSGTACGSASASDPSVSGLKVLGELSGPELPQPLAFETLPGGSFVLPGFQRDGDYLLSNIRLVETATSRVLGTATPSVATIHVRQILLASATVTRLTLAELQARGIAITQESFQALGRLSEVATPGGVTVHYDYDGGGRVKSERTGTDATSGLRRRGYDLMGRLVFTTDGDEGVWRGRFDAWGRLFREELPTGAVVEREYDRAGGLKRETTWDGPPGSAATKLAESLFRVTAAGKVDRTLTLLSAVPESYRVRLKGYDGSGRLVETTSGRFDGTPPPSLAVAPADLKVSRRDLHTVYDTADRPTNETDAAGNELSYDYRAGVPWPTATMRRERLPGVAGAVETFRSEFRRDAFGRVVGEDRKGGGTPLAQHFTKFDQAGNVLSTWSGVGARTTYSHDGLGRVLTVTRPSGGSTRYAYDGDGRPLLRETSRGNSLVELTGWTYEPTGTGRLQSIARPDSTTESFRYNGDDTVDLRTLRSGIQVQYRWDPANRLKSRSPVVDPGGRSPKTDGGDTYLWDPGSRLLSVQRRSSGKSGAWEENVSASVAWSQYDNAGRPGIETVGARPPLKRVFDVWSREAAVELPAGLGRDLARATGYQRAFDPLDRLTELSALPGGETAGGRWEWGGGSRLWGVTANGPLGAAHRYGYPGSGFGTFPSGLLPWKLGRLSVGAPGSSAPKVTDPLGSPWGEFLYGYRLGDETRQGREAADLGSGAGLFAGQGWAWQPDNALRIGRAEAGAGSTKGTGDVPSADVFTFGFGEMDQLLSVTRDAKDASPVTYTSGPEGRIESRNAAPFTYDLEGHRTSDDRLAFTWGWRDELLDATVTDAASPYAGHKVFFEFDALGRLLTRTHTGALPSGGTECATYTSACQRPFIEKRRYLWSGGALLTEAAYAADQPDGSEGPLRWRKSYVPGPSGPTTPSSSGWKPTTSPETS